MNSLTNTATIQQPLTQWIALFTALLVKQIQLLTLQLSVPPWPTGKPGYKYRDSQILAMEPSAISTLARFPPTSLGTFFNIMCHFIYHCSLTSDRPLTTHRNTSAYFPWDPKHKLVSHNIRAGLLFHLQNNHTLTQHPSKSQPSTAYFTPNLQPLLEQFYKHYNHCLVQQQQPRITASS